MTGSLLPRQILAELIQTIRFFHFQVHVCKEFLTPLAISAKQELVRIVECESWTQVVSHEKWKRLYVACLDSFLVFSLYDIEVHEFGDYYDVFQAREWESVLQSCKGSLAYAVGKILPKGEYCRVPLTMEEQEVKLLLAHWFRAKIPLPGSTLYQVGIV